MATTITCKWIISYNINFLLLFFQASLLIIASINDVVLLLQLTFHDHSAICIVSEWVRKKFVIHISCWYLVYGWWRDQVITWRFTQLRGYCEDLSLGKFAFLLIFHFLVFFCFTLVLKWSLWISIMIMIRSKCSWEFLNFTYDLRLLADCRVSYYSQGYIMTVIAWLQFY